MFELSNKKIDELDGIVMRVDEFGGTKDRHAYSFAMEFLYDNDLIIDFDWSKWNEGREFFKKSGDEKYATVDREFALKLLTAIARNDRFNDGAWYFFFESGEALKLLKRLRETYRAG